MLNSIEEGKYILKSSPNYINIKHQAEYILERTTSLGNVDPWNTVMHKMMGDE